MSIRLDVLPEHLTDFLRFRLSEKTWLRNPDVLKNCAAQPIALTWREVADRLEHPKQMVRNLGRGGIGLRMGDCLGL